MIYGQFVTIFRLNKQFQLMNSERWLRFSKIKTIAMAVVKVQANARLSALSWPKELSKWGIQNAIFKCFNMTSFIFFRVCLWNCRQFSLVDSSTILLCRTNPFTLFMLKLMDLTSENLLVVCRNGDDDGDIEHEDYDIFTTF